MYHAPNCAAWKLAHGLRTLQLQPRTASRIQRHPARICFVWQSMSASSYQSPSHRTRWSILSESKQDSQFTGHRRYPTFSGRVPVIIRCGSLLTVAAAGLAFVLTAFSLTVAGVSNRTGISSLSASLSIESIAYPRFTSSPLESVQNHLRRQEF